MRPWPEKSICYDFDVSEKWEFWIFLFYIFIYFDFLCLKFWDDFSCMCVNCHLCVKVFAWLNLYAKSIYRYWMWRSWFVRVMSTSTWAPGKERTKLLYRSKVMMFTLSLPSYRHFFHLFSDSCRTIRCCWAIYCHKVRTDFNDCVAFVWENIFLHTTIWLLLFITSIKTNNKTFMLFHSTSITNFNATFFLAYQNFAVFLKQYYFFLWNWDFFLKTLCLFP